MPNFSSVPAEYWPFIIMGINGLIAGWIAGALLGGGGLLRHLIVGIIGAFVGGALVKYGLLQLPAVVKTYSDMIPGGYGEQIVVSTIGAMLVVIVARFLGGRE